jgi:hypothetical protein
LKFRNYLIVVSLFVVVGDVSHAQKAPSPGPAKIETTVRQARIQAITPHSKAPSWMDYDKVRVGFGFLEKHQKFIQQILGTSSLAATFAAKDITPLLMQTGRLPRDFSQRLKETDHLVNALLQPNNSRDEFLTKNLAQAHQLGLLHAAVAKQVTGALRWNPQERVPMNQQAYGLVLYTFAWWPVEALEATKQIDVKQVQNELEGWFHLWSVIGYGMGVSEGLLPTSYTRAKEIVSLLRKAQYAGTGEKLPEGISVLLGGQVRWLAEGIAAQSEAKPTPEQVQPDAAALLAKVIKLSPGLSEALGLESDPTAQLTRYASTSTQN